MPGWIEIIDAQRRLLIDGRQIAAFEITGTDGGQKCVEVRLAGGGIYKVEGTSEELRPLYDALGSLAVGPKKVTIERSPPVPRPHRPKVRRTADDADDLSAR